MFKRPFYPTILLAAVGTAIAIIGLTAPGCDGARAQSYRLGILNWTEKVPPFRETHRGLQEGLRDMGYREGISVDIQYRNAEQSKNLAVAMARELVSQGSNLIVAIGTGSALAARRITESNGVPLVFTIVGAPKATGLIADYVATGRLITGVSMEVPVALQLQQAREALPQVTTLGILYCDEMPQAVATGQEASGVAREMGWTPDVVVLKKSELPRLSEHSEALAGRVDALYVPTDPILHEPGNLRAILDACDPRKVPVIVVAGDGVEAGALMALHCDFRGIGRQAANMVDQILRGIDVRTIPPQRPGIRTLSVNLAKARELGIEIPRKLILRADVIID